ncbi:MAG: energy transducer TonB, partial [Hyphomicrobiaceae bacterium]|nr:energy transducer TonB [Hyphomicrobiaceae bacterium]
SVLPPVSSNTLRDTTPTPPPPQPPTPVIAPPAPSAAPSRATGAKPKGNPGRWATNDDYPARAQREEREGTAGFRVTIGPDGRVTGCDITASSGHADLDQETCKLVTRRARFDPALDRDGNPTTGSYSNRVRWQIPKE